MSEKSVFLVLTSAIAIDGQICRKGSLVEVSDLEARSFLHRGKARLATAEDGAPEEDEADEPEPAKKPKKSKAKDQQSEAETKTETDSEAE